MKTPAERVLLTGGAGFIGTHLAQRLLESGYAVRILDVLSEQVHGPHPTLPGWMTKECDLQLGDIRDRNAVIKAIVDVDVVIHLAADTGVGQSMTEMHRYADVNVGGTAMLLECLMQTGTQLRKLAIASSRAVYGEGKYRCSNNGEVYPGPRTATALAAGRWDPVCPQCTGSITPLPVDEQSETHPTSVYGVTKLAQEQLGQVYAAATGVPLVILRYQNVYGHGQSMRNPYTGIVTHFANAAHARRAAPIFEDGLQSRDFVHIDDIVSATTTAIGSEATGVFDLGTGLGITVLDLARAIADKLAPGQPPIVTGEYRVGDIRHAAADSRRAAIVWGWRPTTSLGQGLADTLRD